MVANSCCEVVGRLDDGQSTIVEGPLKDKPTWSNTSGCLTTSFFLPLANGVCARMPVQHTRVQACVSLKGDSRSANFKVMRLPSLANRNITGHTAHLTSLRSE